MWYTEQKAHYPPGTLPFLRPEGLELTTLLQIGALFMGLLDNLGDRVDINYVICMQFLKNPNPNWVHTLQVNRSQYISPELTFYSSKL